MQRPRSSLARAGAALLALVLGAVGAAGCGEEEGVAEGATVTAYVEKPLCERPGVSMAQNESGEALAVEFVCLPAARGPQLSQGVGGSRIDLATAGANARRATEDSAAIVYIEPDDPGVARFTHPILEAAGVGWITADSRRQGVRQLMKLLAAADTDDLRADLREKLGQG